MSVLRFWILRNRRTRPVRRAGARRMPGPEARQKRGALVADVPPGAVFTETARLSPAV